MSYSNSFYPMQNARFGNMMYPQIHPPQPTLHQPQHAKKHVSAPPPPTPVEIMYCEPCDKEFNNMNSFLAHKNTHEECSHPGCAFTASKKVVTAHYHSAHGLYSIDGGCTDGYKSIEVEGMQFRVLLGTSPAEISQWREGGLMCIVCIVCILYILCIVCIVCMMCIKREEL